MPWRIESSRHSAFRGKSILAFHLFLSNSSNTFQDVIRSSIDTLLALVLKDPRVCAGAGCFEAILLSAVKKSEFSPMEAMMDRSVGDVSKVYDAFYRTLIDLAMKPSGGETTNSCQYYIDSDFGHLWQKESENSTEILMDTMRNKSCVCHGVSGSELALDAHLLCLSSFVKNATPLFERESSKVIKVKRPLSWGIVDYFPSKLNALRMAFDVFTELLSVGEVYYEVNC